MGRREVKTIFAGEFYVTTSSDVIISTLLGSCVAVCLSDDFNSVYGMNHFMLPTRVRESNNVYSGKYGEDAMELLITEMEKRGARINYMTAKVFGGGQVAGTTHSNVARANIRLAIQFLKKKGIPIIARDVGGKHGRQIYFWPRKNVFSRKIKMTEIKDVSVNE